MTSSIVDRVLPEQPRARGRVATLSRRRRGRGAAPRARARASFDAGLPARGQRRDHLVRVLDERGTVLDQPVALRGSPARFTRPGIARTSRPSSAARRAVISAPLLLRRLHDHHGEDEPRDDRLRVGKMMRQGARARSELRDHARRASTISSPERRSPADRSRPPPSRARRWCGPGPERARGGPRCRCPARVRSRPSPRARPRSAPSRSATSSPYGVARRDPTIATASASSADEASAHVERLGRRRHRRQLRGILVTGARDHPDLIDRVDWIRVGRERAIVIEKTPCSSSSSQYTEPRRRVKNRRSARAAPLPSERRQQCARLACGLVPGYAFTTRSKVSRAAAVP